MANQSINLQDRIRQMQRGRTQSNIAGSARNPGMGGNAWNGAAPAQPNVANPQQAPNPASVWGAIETRPPGTSGQPAMNTQQNPQIRGALPPGTDINPMSGQEGQQPQYGSNEHINAFAQQAMQQGFDPATIAQFIKGQLSRQ